MIFAIFVAYVEYAKTLQFEVSNDEKKHHPMILKKGYVKVEWLHSLHHKWNHLQKKSSLPAIIAEDRLTRYPSIVTSKPPNANRLLLSWEQNLKLKHDGAPTEVSSTLADDTKTNSRECYTIDTQIIQDKHDKSDMHISHTASQIITVRGQDLNRSTNIHVLFVYYCELDFHWLS